MSEFITLWISAGLALFLIADRTAMKQSPPYAEFPAIVPSHLIRVIVLIHYVIFAPYYVFKVAQLLYRKVNT